MKSHIGREGGFKLSQISKKQNVKSQNPTNTTRQNFLHLLKLIHNTNDQAGVWFLVNHSPIPMTKQVCGFQSIRLEKHLRTVSAHFIHHLEKFYSPKFLRLSLLYKSFNVLVGISKYDFVHAANVLFTVH